MNFLLYLKNRMKTLAFGFLLGLVLGYGRTLIFEPEILESSARWILSVQTGIAFAALALFVTNYKELRQRVLQRVEESRSDNP